MRSLSLSLSLSLRIVHVLNMLSSKNVQNWGSRVKKFWDLFLCGNPFGLGEAGEAPKYSVPICVLRIECLPFDAFMHTSCGCHRRVHACACVCVCVCMFVLRLCTCGCIRISGLIVRGVSRTSGMRIGLRAGPRRARIRRTKNPGQRISMTFL